MKPLMLAQIGVLRTPYELAAECPRWPYSVPALGRIQIFPGFEGAIDGLTAGTDLFVLWWGHKSQRATTTCFPADAESSAGVFSQRVMNRPNPLGLSRVRLHSVGEELVVQGLDCVDMTPLLDIKPVVSFAGISG